MRLNKLPYVAFLCLTLVLNSDLAYALYVYYGNYLSALSFRVLLIGYRVLESEITTVYNLTNYSFFSVQVVAIRQEIYVGGNYLNPSNPSEEWVSFHSHPIEVPPSKTYNVTVIRLFSGIPDDITKGSLRLKVHVIIQVLPLITHATRSFEFYE